MSHPGERFTDSPEGHRGMTIWSLRSMPDVGNVYRAFINASLYGRVNSAA